MSSENTETRSANTGRVLRSARDRVVDEWRWLRMWRARGKIASPYWVPRVGDRVKLHGKGHWLVYDVAIRRGEVRLGRPGLKALEHVGPLTPAELDEVYQQRSIRATPQAPPILPPSETETWGRPAETKPVDLDDPDTFTVDGSVVDSPPEE